MCTLVSNNLSYSVVSEIIGPDVGLNVVLRCFRNRLKSNEPSQYN